jgi:seryl-tRNA synthetase
MIDIKLLRENPDLFRKDLKKRKDSEKLKWIDEVLNKDEEYRQLLQQNQDLRHQRNEISKQIGKLKKEGKSAEKELKEASSIPKKIESNDEKIENIQSEIKKKLMSIPNLMHESVPYGKDDSENVEIKKVGKIPKKSFELVNHGELAEKLGIADFDRAAKVAGAGFNYMIGDLALLNQALCNFSIDYMTKKGYTLVVPPLMLNRKAYEGVTDLGDFESVMYKIEDEDLHMIATSEHPLIAYFMNDVIDEDKLPIKLVGFSPCFRKEIGSRGVDTKGFYRMHVFWKVEQIILCKPEDSWKYHEELLANSEGIFKELKLPYRVVNICTGDLGTVASKKYDLEVWMPRQDAYKEACSCSNCTDYQARRLNIKYGKRGGKVELVHTLNNTALATSRALVSILENNQNKDNTVTIPEALRKYMMNKEKIELQKKI